MSILIKPAYGTDASAYFSTAGVTSTAGKQQISRFVIGIKDLGLWSNMVCWPLRSSQNAGTGTTAYSLGGFGTFNGTLTNGPTWGSNGIVFIRTSSHYINIPTTTFSPSSYLFGSVFNPSGTGVDSSSCIIAHNGTSSADAMQINDQTSNGLGGGHRQVAASTYVSPPSQTYTTGVFQFAQQGWTGSVVRRLLNKSSESTANSSAFGGFISPFRISCRGDSISGIGNDKTTAFVYLMQNSGATKATADSIYDLYKSTLGQGLGLP